MFLAFKGGYWPTESWLPTRDPNLGMKVTYIPSPLFGKLYFVMVPQLQKFTFKIEIAQEERQRVSDALYLQW